MSELEGISFEDFLASYEAPRWRLRQWYALRRLPSNVRRWIREFKEFFIRGRHGWAPSDAWSLDHYLAGVIGHSVRHLANTGHGWPGPDTEWPTPEEWGAELHKHADVLIAYSKDWDLNGTRDAGPSIKRLGEFWGHLWD